MPPRPDSDEAGTADEFRQTLRRLGVEFVEADPLEAKARLMEHVEWSLARRTAPGGTDPSKLPD